MEAATVELQGLFDRDIRYLIPVFQRNYLWNRDEHWEPLWTDIVNIAEDLLDVDEGVEPADHFLGAIVCEQASVTGRDAQAVQVIDGQQRITTLQLFLAAMRRVATRRGIAEVDYLTGYLENKPAVVKDRPDHRYKVWPNIADRSAYTAAMEGVPGTSAPQAGVEFFGGKIDRWLDEGDEDDPFDDADNTPEERFSKLLDALMLSVKVVKIDLDAKDNAQVIFETLNARGEPLSDADLIRNHLFRLADEQHLDLLSLHDRYWNQFESAAWHRKISHGRHTRNRLELFLNYWLSMRRRQEVSGSAIFRNFKDHAAGESAETLAIDIATSAGVFESFETQEPDSPAWWFFRRVGEMDLITVYPVMLWLLGQTPDHLPAASQVRAMRAIESYLGRRLLGRFPTRSYGDVFMQVLKRMIDGPVGEADRNVIAVLAEKSAEADRWPNDQEFLSIVLNTNVYRLKSSRLRMVLEAADRAMADDGRAEKITLGNTLWIEHLLPQTWRGAMGWDLPDGLPDPTEAGSHRDHLLHTLGNLTLTTSKFNIELSNRPWPDKLGQIAAHSALALNRDITAHYSDGWDESKIRTRGTQLADTLIRVWPSPEGLLEA